MEWRQAQQRAAQILRIIAGFDKREFDEFEVRAWATAVMREPSATVDEWAQAIQGHYLQPEARRAMPGDILHRVTLARQDREGVHALPKSSGGAPMPPDFAHRRRLALEIGSRFRQAGINPSVDDVRREFYRLWPEYGRKHAGRPKE